MEIKKIISSLLYDFILGQTYIYTVSLLNMCTMGFIHDLYRFRFAVVYESHGPQ